MDKVEKIMIIENEFETKQFISYLDHFTNITIKEKSFNNGNVVLKLSDDKTYEMSEEAFVLLQIKVERFNRNYKVMQ